MNAAPPVAARFVVGIDLGTTNSAVAFAELQGSGGYDPIPAVQTFPIPQLVAPGEVETRETLPSFHYEPAPGEGLDDPGARRLPWGDSPAASIVGTLARGRGLETPGRLVASAKSWLSHTGVDRSADLLPWHGAGDVKKLSPAEASARFLDHLRAAWDHAHPDAPLAAQEVVVTIPASFDEVARGLTLAAARRAGLPRVSLLEEPQAAFYAWVAKDAARAEVMAPGERILVCDIGGGTTDFSLIEARGEGAFHRVAVGDHLILGGDNLDLALAHHVEAQLGAPTLTPRQWGTLVRRCQGAKETLLGAESEAPERFTVSVPAAAGARLVGGARSVDLTRAEVARLLVDGFLPWVELDAQPARRASGFQEFGLPYAPDAGITRYLAAFLNNHGGGRLDAVLLNGGFFESRTLRDRLLVVLESWFGGDPPRVLENARLDLAVALGAVRYGLARRGVGGARKISGGLARAFYVGVHQGERDVALCLAPAGLEEDAEVALEDLRFELRVRQPAEFPLWSSSTRLRDRPGDVLPTDDPELHPLPPLRTALRGRAADETPLSGDAVIPVRLRARLTELGTLEVWCAEENGTRRWKLPFDVRATLPDVDDPSSPVETSPAVVLDEETVGGARGIVRETFGRTGTPPDAESLNKRLETLVGSPRAEWPPTLLRELGDELPALEETRRRAPAFETRWLNFFGFCLRPGYGFPGDDTRVTTAWRLCGERRFFHPRHEPTRAEWAILWRRLAAGLSAGQQRALAAPLLADLRRNAGREWAKQETAEVWRLLGSLELLDPTVRVDLGERLLDAMETPASPPVPVRAALWALGRLGARAPLAGPLNAVLPVETVEAWLDRLLSQGGIAKDATEEFAFTLTQLARRTGDRYRDLPEPARERVLARLTAAGADAHALELVREGGRLQAGEREAAFGESLPRGLRLV